MLTFYDGWKHLQDIDTVQEITIYSQSVFSHFLLPNVLFQFKKSTPISASIWFLPLDPRTSSQTMSITQFWPWLFATNTLLRKFPMDGKFPLLSYCGENTNA